MKDFTTTWKELANTKKLDSWDFVFRAGLIALRNKSNTPKEDIFLGLLNKYFSPSKINGFGMVDRLVKDCINTLRQGKTNPYIFGRTDILENDAEVVELLQIFKSYDEIKHRLGRKYVYYFTAQDVFPEYQGVQAGHALFKLGATLAKEGIDFNPDETYFQWIGVSDEDELKFIAEKHKNVKHVGFIEPDIGNKLTSIAFYPIMWYKRKDFLDYQLLTHSTLEIPQEETLYHLLGDDDAVTLH